MNIRKLLKGTGELIGYNLQCLSRLEIAYRLLSALLFIPLLALGFQSIMNITGYAYLTKENILKFIRNPITILLLLVLLFCIVVIETWHIGTVIFILDQSAQQKKTAVYAAAKYCIKNNRCFWKQGKVAMALYLLFILPFLNMGTGIIGSIRIPEFIMDTILKNYLLSILLVLLYLILTTLVLRWIFAMHYVVTENLGFKQGAKRSAKLGKGQLLRILISLIVADAVIVVLFSIVFLLGEGLILLLNKFDFIAADIMISINGIILAVLVVLFSALAMPVSYAMTTVLFYERKDICGEEILHIVCHKDEKEKHREKKKRRVLGFSLLILVIIFGALFVRGIRHGDYNLNIEHIRTMEVSAHRGASADYPENTMAAFRGAVRQNADWIELDVQQSRDGEIFVMHDTSFLRTTGVNKKCWELSWDEISKLDAGSRFSKEYNGEQIPLLETVIEYAKWSGIRLNIELKPTGHEKDFEQKVIDIINKEHFTDSCVITSQEYKVLENIKKIDPSIRTVYVMSIAVGEVEELKYADDFSIESTFITEELVQRMHNLEKEVYAWTVDSEDSINKMIGLGVDNIITNYVPLAKTCVEKSRTSNIITDLVEEILNS